MGRGKRLVFCPIFFILVAQNDLVNPFPNDKFYTLPNSKSLQTTISNVMAMAESSPKG